MNNCLKLIYQHPLLSEQDLNEIINAHERVTVKKGMYLLERGKMANEYYCTVKGLLRSYVYDYEDNDITVNFFGKNEVVIDVVSLFHRVPSIENIQALTDCDCYKMNLNTFQELFHSIKGLTEWGRAWMSQSLFEHKHRSIAMITDSAKDRYLALQKQQPEILLQAPLKYIATYLGITDTSLSRIRKELSQEGF